MFGNDDAKRAAEAPEDVLKRLLRLLADVPDSPLQRLRGRTPQTEVAAKAALGQGRYSEYETGARDLTRSMAERLAPALGGTPEQILTAQRLGQLKAVAAKSGPEDPPDPQRLLDLILELGDGLPEGEHSDRIIETAIELLEGLLAERKPTNVAAKSSRKPAGSRDALGRRRSKPYDPRR